MHVFAWVYEYLPEHMRLGVCAGGVRADTVVLWVCVPV